MGITHGQIDAIIKLHFGVKRYDYILKFKHSSTDNKSETLRRRFEKKLLNSGVLVERETSVESSKEVYVKIVCPFSLLCSEAQLVKLKLPLKLLPPR